VIAECDNLKPSLAIESKRACAKRCRLNTTKLGWRITTESRPKSIRRSPSPDDVHDRLKSVELTARGFDGFTRANPSLLEVTAGATAEELEKRIAAELIEGSPALFLDNLNNTAFKSDLLASAITERPAKVRLLGKSQMVPLNASALVILTGNGLRVSEDNVRRFIAVDFDARTEDPESRPFKTDIRAEVTDRRRELLAALLTIWRWGRITVDIKSGLPLGSFEQWCRWVRDPLLALGCQDPVERVSEAKERDGRRQATGDLFTIWWQWHRDEPIAVRQLHDDVRRAVDPQDRGRQYIASQLEKLAGTRLAGFVFTRQAPAGKWGAATYALKKTDS
jgi:hypothetical protein